MTQVEKNHLQYLKNWLKREQTAKREEQEKSKRARLAAQQHARMIREIKLQIEYHKAPQQAVA